MPAERSLVTALSSRTESALLAFFLDHKLMPCLHGAEGLHLCQTTWRKIQGDNRLSIGRICAQLGDARLLTVSLERSRHRRCTQVQCPPFGLSCQ